MASKDGNKRRYILGGLAIFLLLTWFFGPRIAAPFIQRKLQAMVAEHLHAQLTVDSFRYDFPMGVRATNAKLITTGPDGKPLELMAIENLELALAEIPWGSGPLVIEKIIAKKPSFNLIREIGGLREDGQPRDGAGLVGTHLVKKQTEEKEKNPNKSKPSDYFRLRYLAIEDGAVIYQTKTKDAAPDAPPASPVVWKGIKVEIKSAPTSGAEYSWEMMATNGQFASANMRGKVDVDAATLDVEKFILAVKVDPSRVAEGLPPSLQEVFKRVPVQGGVTLSGQAHVPLKDMDASVYEASIDVGGVIPELPEYGGRVDRAVAKIKISNAGPDSDGGQRAAVNIGLIDLTTGDTSVRIEKGEAIVDWHKLRWNVKDLLLKVEAGQEHKALPGPLAKLMEKYEAAGRAQITLAGSGPIKASDDRPYLEQIDFDGLAYVRNASFKPSKFGRAFTKVSGTLKLNQKALAIENAQGQYGEDEYFLNSARIPLEGIAQEIQIREVTGSAQMSGRTLDYPYPFSKVIEETHPSGTWYASGNLTRKTHHAPGEKPEYWFDIKADGKAGGTLTKHAIPLHEVKMDITVSNQGVEVRNGEAKCLGGELKGEGIFRRGDKEKGEPATYEGKGWVRSVDLKALKDLLAANGKEFEKLSGTGNANLTFGGIGKTDKQPDPWMGFHAAGKVDVYNGAFWNVPVVEDVVGNTKVKADSLTVGQARGDFEIKEKMVKLQDASLSSPLLGIYGGGTIGFDGALNLRVVAAPLADWKDQIKSTRIPIVSDVAGEVLGGLQKVINGATSTLLYEFKITGTTKDRKVETVPAPALTEGVAKWIRESTK